MAKPQTRPTCTTLAIDNPGYLQHTSGLINTNHRLCIKHPLHQTTSQNLTTPPPQLNTSTESQPKPATLTRILHLECQYPHPNLTPTAHTPQISRFHISQITFTHINNNNFTDLFTLYIRAPQLSTHNPRTVLAIFPLCRYQILQLQPSPLSAFLAFVVCSFSAQFSPQIQRLH